WQKLLQAESMKDDERDKLLNQAAGFNRLAETCFAATPAVVYSQRADLSEKRGEPVEAKRLRDKARERRQADPSEAFLSAREDVVQGRFQQALPVLQELTRQDPKHVHAWFLLARCHDGLHQDEDAVRAYTAALALWPTSHQVYFNRAVAFLRRGQWQAAR